MNNWMKLVLEMKSKYKCTLKEAMQHARPLYKKK